MHSEPTGFFIHFSPESIIHITSESLFTSLRNDYSHRPESTLKPVKPGAAASLIPNFDFVAIRVGDVGVGVAWAEFASPEQLAAGTLDFVDSSVDVAW